MVRVVGVVIFSLEEIVFEGTEFEPSAVQDDIAKKLGWAEGPKRSELVSRIIDAIRKLPKETIREMQRQVREQNPCAKRRDTPVLDIHFQKDDRQLSAGARRFMVEEFLKAIAHNFSDTPEDMRAFNKLLLAIKF